MNLSELAFFCHCYSNITRYDKAYLHFLNRVKSKPDLENENDRLEILAWLNKFGCRQFAKKYHSEASNSIKVWYDNYCDKINSIPNNILELKDNNYSTIKEFYKALMESFASKQNRNGNTVTMSFGATGTAKFLFTIKPNTFAPWDDAIRKKLKYNGSAESYMQYLRKVVDNINELKNICKEKGLSLDNLPTIVNRANSSLPKIIDEYFWMKYTQDAKPPDKKMLNNWLDWLQ
jgi:hypothetical protein